MWAVQKRGVRTQGHILLHHGCVFSSKVPNEWPQYRVQYDIIQDRKWEMSKSALIFQPNKEAVFEHLNFSSTSTCKNVHSPAPSCSSSSRGRKYESGRVSLAPCPLMAHPITRTWALHKTCAQEAWRYCCYTTETGYSLFTNLGSCPQPPSYHYKGDERRAQRMCELQPILDRKLVGCYIGCKDIFVDDLWTVCIASQRS